MILGLLPILLDSDLIEQLRWEVRVGWRRLVWWLVNCLGKDGIPVQLARAAWQAARPKLQGRLSSCPAQVEEPLSASTPVTYPGASYPPVSSTNSWSGEVSKLEKNY